MKQMSLIFLVFFLIVINLFSQNEEFKVLVSTGKNEVLLNNKWEELKPKSIINDAARIKTSPGCYLAIVSDKGQTLEITEKGEYSYNDLLVSSKQNRSLLGNLITLLKDKIFSTSKIDSFFGVKRSDTVNNQIIDLYFPDTTYILDPFITLRWYKDKDKKENKYEITVATVKNQTIFMNVVEDTVFVLDTKEYDLKEKEYKISVASSSNKNKFSMGNVFLIPNDANRKKILDTIETFQPSDKKVSFFSSFLTALILERNSFVLDAEKYFSKSLDLTNNNPEFGKLYLEFLIKNGFIKNQNLGFLIKNGFIKIQKMIINNK